MVISQQQSFLFKDVGSNMLSFIRIVLQQDSATRIFPNPDSTATRSNDATSQTIHCRLSTTETRFRVYLLGHTHHNKSVEIGLLSGQFAEIAYRANGAGLN